MWLIDFPTLMIVLFSAIYLGLVGVVGHPVEPFDKDTMRWLFLVAGASGFWQLVRQRWR